MRASLSYLHRALAKREVLICISPFWSGRPWYMMKPSFLNLFIKKVHARACSADHRCQGLLRYSGKSVKLAPIPLSCEQKKSAGESPLAAMRNLVD